MQQRENLTFITSHHSDVSRHEDKRDRNEGKEEGKGLNFQESNGRTKLDCLRKLCKALRKKEAKSMDDTQMKNSCRTGKPIEDQNRPGEVQEVH